MPNMPGGYYDDGLGTLGLFQSNKNKLTHQTKLKIVRTFTFITFNCKIQMLVIFTARFYVN